MKLPLLLRAIEMFRHVDLSDYALVGCQHLLGTTIDLCDAFHELGMPYDQIFLIGKCYSTNQEVTDELKMKGVTVSELSSAFDPSRSFDEQFMEYIDQFTEQALVHITEKKIIVLDDGGHVIESVMKRSVKDVCAVEQTTAGYRKVEQLNPSFPVVNVARSKAKLQHESPHIADKVVEKMREAFGRYDMSQPNILVIGNGSIGSHIVERLRRYGYATSVCDEDLQKCDFDGHVASRFNEFDCIVGTTGHWSLDVSKESVQPGVMLVSASSSDREFNAVMLRKDKEVTLCHDDVVTGQFILMNGGFPINFDGERHSVDPEKIQLTRALLLAGVVQAAQETRSGLVDLDAGIQKELVEFSVN